MLFGKGAWFCVQAPVVCHAHGTCSAVETLRKPHSALRGANRLLLEVVVLLCKLCNTSLGVQWGVRFGRERNFVWRHVCALVKSRLDCSFARGAFWLMSVTRKYQLRKGEHWKREHKEYFHAKYIPRGTRVEFTRAEFTPGVNREKTGQCVFFSRGVVHTGVPSQCPFT